MLSSGPVAASWVGCCGQALAPSESGGVGVYFEHGNATMAGNVDPNAPYKVYDGEKLIGTYATRAEARRKQQQLEKEVQRQFVVMKDKHGRIVL